ncbi:MAG: hypothetical protein AUK51_00285 [Comamonadaceae bacterium CG2_30_59_20]|nr:MAG: hypothetical protein AUK51_00285 [Comamonadaceae bacterium CG2_30_59_20]
MKFASWHWLPAITLAAALPTMAQTQMTGNKPVQRELIYCADQMTHAEREAYRASMQAAATPQAQDALRADHQRSMQERARAAGRAGQCNVQLRQRAGQGFQGGASQ